MEPTELEIALVDKKKADLRSQYNQKLNEIADIVPDFSEKEKYKDMIVSVFDEMEVDTQYNRHILNEQWIALSEVICLELSTTTQESFGIEHLCP